MTPPFALPPFDFPLPAYVRRAESGLLVPDSRLRRAVLPGLMMPPGLMNVGKLKGVLLTDQKTNSNALTTYTFSGVNFGPAQSDRHIVIGVASFRQSATRDVSSVSINGSPPTTIHYDRWATSYILALYMRAVPNGEAGDVAIAHTNSMEGCGISVWALYGLQSATPTGTTHSPQRDRTTVNASLNVVPGSIVIALNLIFTNGTSGVSTTWSGVPKLFDKTIVQNRGIYSAGSMVATAASTPLEMSVTGSITINEPARRNNIVAAAWV